MGKYWNYKPTCWNRPFRRDRSRKTRCFRFFGLIIVFVLAPFCCMRSVQRLLFPRASERRVPPIVRVCISSSHLHIFKFSHHLLIFTSAHLHICSSSHLLIFTFSHHLHIFTSSHLHIFSSSHLLIFTSSHLHILTFSHLLIFTHIFTSLHLHICSSSLERGNTKGR